MAKRRVALTHRKQRSVLTDMLPFEVPPTFSNRGFYRFLRDHGVEIEQGQGYTLIKVKHLINNMKIPINALESYGMRPAN